MKSGEAAMIRGVGDFNGDKVDDIVAFSSSMVAIIFGKKKGLADQLNIKDLDAKNGFVVNQTVNAVGVGDFNGDNIDDIVLSSGYSSNKYYLVSGKTGTFSVKISSPEAISDVTFAAPTGVSLTGAAALGDVNNDGFADLLIGASGYNSSKFQDTTPPTAIFGSKHNSASGSGIPVGAIVGIVCGAAFVAVLLVVGIYKYFFKAKHAQNGEVDHGYKEIESATTIQ
eukprot:gb/GECG01007467.1/.p1 GENE.gb/GECG01007467.1/~~gb/GECG01007467.1/.p1  ORF type:complete len:226 (+),score=35.84 gb/GECG01007467.1/:1-678(+)